MGPHAFVGLVHLDMEGMELQALRGAELLLRRCKPVVVVEENDKNREIKDFMRGLQYKFKSPKLGRDLVFEHIDAQ